MSEDNRDVQMSVETQAALKENFPTDSSLGATLDESSLCFNVLSTESSHGQFSKYSNMMSFPVRERSRSHSKERYVSSRKNSESNKIHKSTGSKWDSDQKDLSEDGWDKKSVDNQQEILDKTVQHKNRSSNSMALIIEKPNNEIICNASQVSMIEPVEQETKWSVPHNNLESIAPTPNLDSQVFSDLNRKLTEMQPIIDDDVTKRILNSRLPVLSQRQLHDMKLNQNPNIKDPRKRAIINSASRLKLLRPILVLDLDETLINANTGSRGVEINRELKENPKFKDFLPLVRNFVIKGFNSQVTVLIIVRPNLPEFFETLTKYYDIHLYTHGRQEYVEDVLVHIDPNSQYINRERIFYHNKINVIDEFSKKTLSKLGLTPEEEKRAIIIDDLKQIWKEYDKVLPSKKFIPLQKFMDEKKYRNFILDYINDKDQQVELKLERDDLPSYAETDYHKKNQLHYMILFLEEIAFKYYMEQIMMRNVKNAVLPTLEYIADLQRKSTLKGCTLKILSSDGRRMNLFIALAKRLGAEVEEGMDMDRLTEVVIDTDKHINHIIAQYLDNVTISMRSRCYAHIKLLKIDWLLQSFFDLHRKDPTLFRFIA